MSDARFALLIVAVVLAFHVIIIAMPLGYSFYLSLHETNIILRRSDYVGFDMWQEALDTPEVIQATLLSLEFAAISVVLSFALSLGIAVVLDLDFPLRGLLRALVLMPWAISEIVTAGMWTMVTDPGWGVFNGILVPLGIVPEGFVWLNENWALFWLSVAFVWHIAPLGAFFFLAALQSIPDALYRAARMDGAGPLARFWYVTVPHIRYAVLIVLVVMTVDAFRQFDLVYAYTAGGPGTVTELLPLQIYRFNFQFSQYGLASASSFILIIIATVLATAYFFLLSRRRRVEREVRQAAVITG
ncbi:MAG: sugar ABC transporter permease [Alphaproteobacteria bacterium]|nr:sugar ABC transporter permease [Alphaproteobacteria bacterium]